LKEQIPSFLIKQLKKERVLTSSFPDEIKTFMYSYAKFYKWSENLSLIHIFKLMQQKVTYIPLCEYEGCSKLKKVNQYGCLTPGCSKTHNTKITNLRKYGVETYSQTEECKNNFKTISMEKYGVENPFQSEEIKDKIKQANLEKYGVENPFQSEEIKDKIKQTNLEKYGVENPSQSIKLQDKKKMTWYNNYGMHPFQSEEIKAKIKQTNLEKYGVCYPMQNENIVTKVKQSHLKRTLNDKMETVTKTIKTNLKRYGCSYPMQNAEILHKNQNSLYKRKEYIWASGEISLVQGNEPIVLKELENQGYVFSDILTSPKDMPKIKYNFDNSEHLYYPDIFIPKDNIIIEVKSDYILNLQWDKNQAKFQAVRNLGYDFRLEIR